MVLGFLFLKYLLFIYFFLCCFPLWFLWKMSTGLSFQRKRPRHCQSLLLSQPWPVKGRIISYLCLATQRNSLRIHSIPTEVGNTFLRFLKKWVIVDPGTYSNYLVSCLGMGAKISRMQSSNLLCCCNFI